MEHLAWPAMTLILGLVFMLLFRKDVSSFLGRTQKIGKDGIQTSFPQVQQATDKESSIEELIKEFSSVAIREQEDNIKKELEKKGFQHPQDKINLLIRHLAISQLAFHFERINATIWRSQILILEHLNSREAENSESIKSFYDYAAKLYPETFANYSFEQYVQFLIQFDLIRYEGQRYCITNLGREFLVYIAATGQTKSRLF
ncbi:MAG: hypothetical protein HY808_13885 [Nitrospirae bacterium]|nr:hypothetical protein [Nitrospirota bacterium]